jgi:hypothetical protein
MSRFPLYFIGEKNIDLDRNKTEIITLQTLSALLLIRDVAEGNVDRTHEKRMFL